MMVKTHLFIFRLILNSVENRCKELKLETF